MPKQRENIDTSLNCLIQTLASLESVDELRAFLNDLCTPAELRSLADRWLVAQQVERNIPYRRIHELTGVSTATITRVARHVSYGAGGYRIALQKQKETR